MKQLIELTAEKFQEIYTSEKFRNEVAYAHGCITKTGEYKKTCSYPVEYIVTEDQIKAAKDEVQRAKKQAIEELKGKLVFVGMGMDYEGRDDVGNHRIRTEFKNKDGRHFFVEFGTGRGEQMRVDFSIDRDLENQYEAKRKELYEKRNQFKTFSPEWHEVTNEIDKYLNQPYYNFAGLQRKTDLPTYTKANILQLINENFNCNFQEMIVDNYTLRPEDFICVSPK